MQVYLGQILLVPYNFAPQGFVFCQGQLLPIDQYDALYTLLGTTYGGDGQTTFGVPDLRGRSPIHFGQGPGLQSYNVGQTAGVESVTLTTNQLPPHSHAAMCVSAKGSSPLPANGTWAQSNNGTLIYNKTETPNVNLAPGALAAAGNSQPHDNQQPYLTLNYVLAIYGIYPSQN